LAYNHEEMAEEKRYFQFDGTNFSNWKFRIQTFLEEKQLIEYVDEDYEQIVNGLNGEEVRAHYKN